MEGKESKKRKYVLFKAEDGRPDHLKPCAFYASAEGCKNGSKCRFLHETVAESVVSTTINSNNVSRPNENDAKASQKRAKVETANVAQPSATRESDEIKMLREQMLMQQKMFEQQMEMMKQWNQNSGKASVPAPPAPATATPVAAAKKTPIKAPTARVQPPPPPAVQMDEESTASSSDDEQFLFAAVNHVLKSGVNQTTPITPSTTKALNKQQAEHRAPLTVSQESAESSDDDENPDDIFVRAGNGKAKSAAVAAQPSKKKDIFASSKASTASPSPAPVHVKASASLPASKGFSPSEVNFAGLDFAPLVGLTKAHKRYAVDYNFTTDYTWVSTAASVKGALKVLAIDCEMCETTDPVTNTKETNSLVRFSVVDGTNPTRVVIDQLVSPMNPITDARSRIHGITEEQLATVKFTLRHAQAALLKLIDSNTILIGHALFHDLKALHIVHENVIDTSYLFSNPDPEVQGSIPSLKMLVDQILHLRLPNTHHDPTEDARASLYAAAYYIVNDGVFPQWSRNANNHRETGARSSNGTASSNDGASLLVHHIPSFCGEDHIERMFSSTTNIIPTKVSPIVRAADSTEDAIGRSLVFFASARHAELAFDSITGANKPDKQNRPQKRVYLKNGGYIIIRK